MCISARDLAQLDDSLARLDRLFARIFIGDRQQDMQEAVVRLLGLLNTDLAQILPPWVENIIPSLFEFSFVTRIEAKDGSDSVEKEEKDCCLGFSLPENGVVSLLDCFSAFTMVGELSGDNQWKVSEDPDVFVDAKRQTRFTTLPRVLIVHLRRYVFDWTRGALVKISCLVEFSETLEIDDVLSGTQGLSATYALRFMAAHRGEDDAGHFVAYVSVDDTWYLCSDLDTGRVDLSDVLRDEPYLLFYEQQLE
jgi:ubiquitin carboxyl-terminal hydrolase 7